MTIWDAATHAAAWILIGGALAVFGWFLAEVGRLARRQAPGHDAGPNGTRTGEDSGP